MVNPHVDKIGLKKALFFIGFLLALSLLIAFFLFFYNSKEPASSLSENGRASLESSTRLECQRQGQCECELKESQDRDRSVWECVRPLPQACMFNPENKQKTVNSLRFIKIRDGLETITDIDFCTGELVLKGQASRRLDQDQVQKLLEHLNDMNFLHSPERYFPQPDYFGPENYITVEFRSEAGADSLPVFKRTVSCADNCSQPLQVLIQYIESF